MSAISPDHDVTRLSDAVLERIVDVARLAPSIHNTQPWTWVGRRDGALELWADRNRSLPATDPAGRHLLVSCGTALHHAEVAAAAFALRPVVERLPDPARPDLLAVVRLEPGTPGSPELLDAIRDRRTDRRRFTSWPLPADRLARVVAAATTGGVAAVPVSDPRSRDRVERLLEEARTAQLRNPEIIAETARWLHRNDEDGIPGPVLPNGAPGQRYPHRFMPTPADLVDSGLGRADRLVILATADNRPLDWLRAGESLSTLWLQATLDGLSVVPLSQAVEHESTRLRLRTELPPATPYPQILVRLGWQLIGRPDLPTTPRRPLAAILRFDGRDGQRPA